jgi:hypothetical protein
MKLFLFSETFEWRKFCSRLEALKQKILFVGRQAERGGEERKIERPLKQ